MKTKKQKKRKEMGRCEWKYKLINNNQSTIHQSTPLTSTNKSTISNLWLWRVPSLLCYRKSKFSHQIWTIYEIREKRERENEIRTMKKRMRDGGTWNLKNNQLLKLWLKKEGNLFFVTISSTSISTHPIPSHLINLSKTLNITWFDCNLEMMKSEKKEKGRKWWWRKRSIYYSVPSHISSHLPSTISFLTLLKHFMVAYNWIFSLLVTIWTILFWWDRW